MSISLVTWKGPGWCRWCNALAPYVTKRGVTSALALCKPHTLKQRARLRKKKGCKPWKKGKRGRPPLV